MYKTGGGIHITHDHVCICIVLGYTCACVQHTLAPRKLPAMWLSIMPQCWPASTLVFWLEAAHARCANF